LKKIQSGDKHYSALGDVLLGYITAGIKNSLIEKYTSNVSPGSIKDYDVWTYIKENIPKTYGIQAPDVAVLSIKPQVREIYGLPQTAEAMYIPDIKAIIVQNKDCNKHIFNGTMVHEYIHYIQDVLGLFSQSIYSILCPKCNSANIIINDVGKSILGVPNSIGSNVRRKKGKEQDYFHKDKTNGVKDKISDYMFVNDGLLWMEKNGWESEGIPSVGYRLYRKFYYSEKFDKIIPNSTRMDQSVFLVELFVTPQRKIESFNFYIDTEEDEEEVFFLEDEELDLYTNLLNDVFSDDLSQKSIENIVKVIQYCVLNKGYDQEKTYNIYQNNYNDLAVGKKHIKEAINFLSYQTSNQYKCNQCDHEFKQIPLSKQDAQNIMGIVNKLHYGQGLSAEQISESLDNVIPSSFFDRAIEAIEISKLDYYERPSEIMAFSEQFKYLKSIKEKGQDKYSDERIFNAYKKYFIQKTSEDILHKDIKEALILIEGLDFSNMFWRDVFAYKKEASTKCQKEKKEKIVNTMKEYKDYYSKEKSIISKNKNHKIIEALKYLENLYTLIKNSDILFYC
jgi:hypothetical protein